MSETTCNHKNTKTGEPRAYAGKGVAVYPYTHQNPAASGGIVVRVTCMDCGRSRLENRNGRHVEEGPWRYPEKKTKGTSP